MRIGRGRMTENMLEAEALTKRFGTIQALAGLDLAAPAGSILGVLGPNGAGKTTALRILTTLALPDSGRALVAGYDVVRDPAAVRRNIGVAAQNATLDELLTGRQNLLMVGELSQMRRADARARSEELLRTFELTDAASRLLKGYSGGMRRRLDLAASMMTRPPVLFLDEPTTGLGPVSRQRVWETIRELLGGGGRRDRSPGGRRSPRERRRPASVSGRRRVDRVGDGGRACAGCGRDHGR